MAVGMACFWEMPIKKRGEINDMMVRVELRLLLYSKELLNTNKSLLLDNFSKWSHLNTLETIELFKWIWTWAPRKWRTWWSPIAVIRSTVYATRKIWLQEGVFHPCSYSRFLEFLFIQRLRHFHMNNLQL